MARNWDAATYDRIADPMARWGIDVLSRLALSGHERVLDAGCGSGRVTEQLLERLPHGQVVALDGSPSMLAEAARRLARYGERVEFVCADLRRPLPMASLANSARASALLAPVDAILSTATFHWVPDHDALFRHLAAVLRAGGQLVAQCGGGDNIATVRRAIRLMGDNWPGPWTFATPEDTRRRLETAGFVDVQVWLHDEPTPLAPGKPLETYLATIVLGAHLERLPPGTRRAYVRVVAAALPRAEIDYVRLNIVARRA